MQKIIAITGPTASGKTSLGIALAKKFGGEIISADSRQVYRGMKIISGAASKKEQGGILHHLLGFADPRRKFSAGEFVKQAERSIIMIYHNDAVPIVVGGTGFYIDALLGGAVLPEVPPNQALRARLEKKSAPQLLAQLRRLDPARAAAVDPHNKVRLVRAIEVAKALGKVPALERAEKYDVLWLGVLLLRDKKYEMNVRQRIETRLRRGAAAEVKKMRAMLSSRRFGELGAEFTLLARFAERKISREALIEELVRWEMHYAKRQMRWLKRNERIHWISNTQEAFKLASSFIQKP